MPNVSVSDGWWTFQNVGSLTTTFTQPTGCSSNIGLMSMSQGIPWYEYSVQCTRELDIDPACLPSVTATPTSQLDFDTWAGYGSYYSPGLYCPSGWATVGVAARDDNKSLSQSGWITVSTSKQSQSFDLPKTLVASLLEPRETVAFCCPSSMTPDGDSGCYSLLPDYKPTKACDIVIGVDYDYASTSTMIYTDATTTETGWEAHGDPTATHSSLDTLTHTHSEELSTLTAVSYMPMVTILHHQSDIKSDATATAGSKSNAAGRVSSRPSWNGLSASMGVSALAMALGAAMVFMA